VTGGGEATPEIAGAAASGATGAPGPALGEPVDHRAVWLRRAIYVVVTLGIAAFILQGANGPEDPVLAPVRSATPGSPSQEGTTSELGFPGCAGPDRASIAPIEGFGEVALRVTAADGSTAFDGCARLASTPALRAQGLMGQQGLGGYDAMVFRFDQPSTGAFYMFQTVLPLSIAYIGEDGGLVSSTDMDPCPEEEASACPTFPAAGPYLHAIEVGQGDLPALGIVPGATVTFEEQP